MRLLAFAVQAEHGSTGEITFGSLRSAFPSSSSSAARNSATARVCRSGRDQSISSGALPRYRLASASITLASTAKPSPLTRPASMQARTTASNTWRKMSLSRKRPWRLTENVEWSAQYPYAALDLQSCIRLAPRVVDDASLEKHATFMARLQQS